MRPTYSCRSPQRPRSCQRPHPEARRGRRSNRPSADVERLDRLVCRGRRRHVGTALPAVVTANEPRDPFLTSIRPRGPSRHRTRRTWGEGRPLRDGPRLTCSGFRLRGQHVHVVRLEVEDAATNVLRTTRRQIEARAERESSRYVVVVGTDAVFVGWHPDLPSVTVSPVWPATAVEGRSDPHVESGVHRGLSGHQAWARAGSRRAPRCCWRRPRFVHGAHPLFVMPIYAGAIVAPYFLQGARDPVKGIIGSRLIAAPPPEWVKLWTTPG